MSPSPPRPAALKRTRAGSSQPQPRFSTPRRGGHLQPIRDDDSIMSGSGMDVDDNASDIFERGPKADAVFSKSKEMTVTLYAQLPAEVKQALRNADFLQEGYTGDVDPITGFAVVMSTQTCFVWKYSQALTGTPTCYIFDCSMLVEVPMATHFHALVPYGSQREPGLIITSCDGRVRFWDSIGMGLAGGENFSFSSLGLAPGELVTTLMRADPLTFIASTSAGRLFRFTVTSSGGRYHLSTQAFGRPSGGSLSLTRLLPGFWSTPELQPTAGNINAVAVANLARGATGRIVWALVDTRLQQWNMSVEGWDELLAEEDISEQLRVAVWEHFQTAPKDEVELDLELLDLKLQGSHDMIMLVSFAGREDYSSESESLPRRIYAVISLKHLPGSFQVLKVRPVPYQSTSSSGAPIHPRLQILLPERVLAVQFGDAVTVCALINEYMDRLELKSTTDRTLGVGVAQEDGSLLVLTASTMMRVTVDMEEVARFDPVTGAASLIKSTMTKAILYGSLPENPLYFSFPPEIDEDALMTGAEQLSAAVLESDTEVVRAHHDLNVQMTTRKERLSFLIKFINDNSALGKMSQASRQKLAADAEKLYAAHQLWLRHGDMLRGSHSHGILHQAVYVYMQVMGEGHHEDCLRAFLRLRTRNLAGLLPHVLELVRESTTNVHSNSSEALSQGNMITLTVLQGARSYREYNLGVYGITLPMIDVWTSQVQIIDIVNELFTVTTQFVEAPASDQESASAKKVPRSQMPDLAACLLKCFQERLECLQSVALLRDTALERERSKLSDRFRERRPDVLEILRRNDFANEAFKLAEEYHDFRSLAALCHKGKIYPPQENPNVNRIEAYIDKFKEAFTDELYQWYIEHGELRALFAQEHIEYMDLFFAEHSYPTISWIHDLGCGHYGAASKALQSEAEHASELVSKHFMLSIGKLAHLAQLHEGQPTVSQETLDEFHDGLDFVSVHETLITDLKSALVNIRGRQSLEQQIESIAKEKASNLSTRKAFYNVFKYLVRLLLQGKALSIEDMADALVLKDNTYHVEDYASALQLLARAENLPSARRIHAFQNVWRRIFIHDDWNYIRQTTGVTDAELNDRLRRTALYAALLSIARRPRQAHPEGHKLAPSQVLDIASQEEIALRWPSMSPDEITSIETDYGRDCRKLEDYNLEGIYQSMEQLVQSDLST
ncbi:uncharacterized protein BXZ73DRAFT_86275 [Epithele typhae]|uniref:uncharacterized protein n=1 Tax=Epithele typhae TaxID=378194 RepID=UPI002007839C|nr:uncharacterized protein BXZ73DRAFT_86275 [Epithele typhae]KAH9946079.1 hypothetical protein BXZ73DRAFT_86275 [Epithele typhae]